MICRLLNRLFRKRKPMNVPHIGSPIATVNPKGECMVTKEWHTALGPMKVGPDSTPLFRVQQDLTAGNVSTIAECKQQIERLLAYQLDMIDKFTRAGVYPTDET